MQITTGFASLDNFRMYYEEAGAGKPLLLLHSGIADHRMWATQVHAFSSHYRVITPDFRSYGKSDIPDAPYAHYIDIHEFTRQLGLTKVNVVGCSLGGKTALELAIAFPEIVEKLILVAPGLSGYEYKDMATLEQDKILERLIQDNDQEGVVDKLIDIWLVGLKRKRIEVTLRARSLVHDMIMDNYQTVIDRYPEKSPGFDVISRLSEIRRPLLVMIGDNDLPDMQKIAQLIVSAIPGGRKQILPDTAHLPNLEDPKLFNQTVLEFLTSGK